MHVNRFSRRAAVFHEKTAPKIITEHSTPDYGLFQTQEKKLFFYLSMHALSVKEKYVFSSVPGVEDLPGTLQSNNQWKLQQ